MTLVQEDWEISKEVTDQERTNDGEVICEVATGATTTQTDRDVMLDQLVQLLSIPGAEDVFARLPQRCKELVNGAALEADDVDESESNKVLMELSGGAPFLNVTSVKRLTTGGQRAQTARQAGRTLKDQADWSHTNTNPSSVDTSTAWQTGV